MTEILGRRPLFLFGLMLPLRHVAAASPEPDSLPVVSDLLETAKSKAEDAVHIVSVYGDNPSVKIGAMQSYSRARAAFNGFIESLIIERDPSAALSTVSYRNELDQAREAQEAFLNFVQINVVDALPKGGKAPLSDLFGGVGHLFEGLGKLGDTAVALNKEYTREPDARREEIHKRLDGLKWLQFSRIQ